MLSTVGKAAETITLFDLPSKPPCCTWSLNPWKTRLLLNYKGIDYKTEWVEYPDIKGRLEKHVPPNEKGIPYTIPTVIMPDGNYIMDSRKIATAVEELFPRPSVHLDSSYLPKIEEIMRRVAPAIKGIFVPQVPKRLLNDASLDYWYTTREQWFGMPLDQMERELGGDDAWANAGSIVKEATALLEENQDGPFFMGKTISYADFVWGGFLIFLRRIGPDVFEKLLGCSGNAKVHEDLVAGLAEWSKRDDR